MKPDELCNNYDMIEITDLSVIATEFIETTLKTLRIPKMKPELKPDYDEFKSRFGGFYKGGK